MLLLSVTETKKKAFNFPQNIMLNSQMNDTEYAINPSGFETARRKEEMLLFVREIFTISCVISDIKKA